MFRRAFLAEHDLTFPEGRRRLEDHVFVVSAYLHARTISVLSDYPCYFHTARDDGGNAGFRPLEPVALLRQPARRPRRGGRPDRAGAAA